MTTRWIQSLITRPVFWSPVLVSLKESFSVSVLLSQLTQRHVVQRTFASNGDPQICVVCIEFYCY